MLGKVQMKKNRKDFATAATGGYIQNISQDKEIEVKVPPITEPEKPPVGFAKASPNFKEIPPKTIADKKQAKKAVEDNEIGTEDLNEKPT